MATANVVKVVSGPISLIARQQTASCWRSSGAGDDTLDDADVLSLLRDWNAGRRPQKPAAVLV
jgi:hypothetical protein